MRVGAGPRRTAGFHELGEDGGRVIGARALEGGGRAWLGLGLGLGLALGSGLGLGLGLGSALG